MFATKGDTGRLFVVILQATMCLLVVASVATALWPRADDCTQAEADRFVVPDEDFVMTRTERNIIQVVVFCMGCAARFAIQSQMASLI
mmetsp:Transcript_43964/g.116201  ORF Transcript_43964/g.116201 Transcript_43964/m.116201 type:complete len:88 (-) Transcript_43964:78-341(-)